MSYSIKTILHSAKNKQGLQKLQIKVTYKGIRLYATTPYLVEAKDFVNGEIKKHTHAKAINFNLKVQSNEIEARIVHLLQTNLNPSKEQLKSTIEGKAIGISTDIESFVSEVLRLNDFSEGRYKHYMSVKNKLIEFAPGLRLGDMNTTFLQNFEANLRKANKYGVVLANNTIKANMTIIKSILNKAVAMDLIEAKQFKGYKNLRYVENIPEYLTESEVKSFNEVTLHVKNRQIQLAGLYFLLSCYTGYRISDLYLFNKNEMIRDDMLTIRAKKNKQIVSIPVHDKLKAILDLINNEKLDIAEQTMRKYVKGIAKLAGITRPIKVHSARHTFGMMLAEKGFNIEEAAELMGDSIDVVKTYYRITNSQLKNKILDRFK